MSAPRQFLRALFDAAVESASPHNCMANWLPPRPAGRTVVVGAGKAAASMARQLEESWPGPIQGIVIVPYGHAVTCASIEVVEAAHPVPDEPGVAASRKILDAVAGLAPDDTVVCLLSGGGSSLLCVPVDGVSLAEKQAINSQLLRSGAAIHEINTVRRKLSAIKGGRLAAACAPARVITLAISDVPGNDISIIASGPTIEDSSSFVDALETIDRYEIDIAPRIRAVIENSEPVRIADGDVRVLATSGDALLAAATLADERGIAPYSLGDLAGDARDLAKQHADLALSIAAGNGPLQPPCVLLSGGETTVKTMGGGRGGRNGEYALALTIALRGHPSIYALAADTDGIDGSGDNAGCMVTPDSLQRAQLAGADAAAAQQDNDSYAFFAAIDDLIMTGPTRTNVNDIRAILISADGENR
jgi:glycerate 2-kinase